MLEVVDVGVAHITKREKMLRYYGRMLEPGRANDQDAYMIDEQYDCFAVADGVGGSTNSDVAAKAVCEAYRATVIDHFGDTVSKSKSQREYVSDTLQRVHAAAIGALATTTFTGLTIHADDTASYLHVGDSQLLLLRDDEVIHCTSEHVAPDGYQLLNYLGTQPEWKTIGYARHSLELTVEANAFSTTKLEAEWGSIRLKDGDRLALMTDGVLGSGQYERLDDDFLQECLHRRLGATAFAQLVMTKSRKEDDSTLVIVDLGLLSNTVK
jgi:serine/threonine protein phosphatase PrpC